VHGDFSLNPLAYREDVSRVLIQQGRVQLDSDANEQTESLLRFLRGLAFDVIGAHGGIGDSFLLDPVTGDPTKRDLQIRWGVYYVDGIRCVNYPPNPDLWQRLLDISHAPPANAAKGRSFRAQRLFQEAESDWLREAKPMLLYLDAFERHVSAAEDPTLSEVALLGPDTASRAVVVWQVRATPFAEFEEHLKKVGDEVLPPTWDKPYIALNLMLRSGARLRPRAVVTEATEPCTVAPDARYRGSDNRLFRVEIHDEGDAAAEEATFKWSPDNGAIAFPVRDIEGKTIHLDSLGRDARSAIQVNDWVEVVDDEVLLTRRASPLLQVKEVHPYDMTVILNHAPKVTSNDHDTLHRILRRWAAPPMPLREGTTTHDGWFELADGVEVQFSHVDVPYAHYRTGDYWLIPTRTATGDVIWPHDNGLPSAVGPHGVDHHYAPLARVTPGQTPSIDDNYSRHFDPIAEVK
jgi:hypothetical protein